MLLTSPLTSWVCVTSPLTSWVCVTSPLTSWVYVTSPTHLMSVCDLKNRFIIYMFQDCNILSLQCNNFNCSLIMVWYSFSISQRDFIWCAIGDIYIWIRQYQTNKDHNYCQIKGPLTSILTPRDYVKDIHYLDYDGGIYPYLLNWVGVNHRYRFQRRIERITTMIHSSQNWILFSLIESFLIL